ncbi:unnamed protein product [Rotaria sp. Silwood2]|nr:unnamed protein product [Rotaria sp. Silwood2]CAF2605122.1 unnamed protein product [Rotaria sp. Silwood2]CAF2847396.1 unnamed protein product [Rotaria sp. Silwood2]CAF4147555.1 unnamed protein product [Rotaria sp. Silwood2]CAF4183413.1 unnamed protein product [Rotaria sp. Silwood2]
MAGEHLVEAARCPSRAAPTGIIGTCVCSAIVGYMCLFALLFAISNVKTFIENNSENNEPMNFTVAIFR